MRPGSRCLAGRCVLARSKLNEQLISEAVKLVQTGLNDADVCDALGIHPSSWYGWIKAKDTPLKKRLAKEVVRAKAMRKAYHLQNVVNAARDGNWQASAWYLERAYPQEYGRCQRLPEKDEKALDAVRELMKTVTIAAERDAQSENGA
nr:MAG TPA: putative terminase small subunit [Caudoviricetes sp.]